MHIVPYMFLTVLDESAYCSIYGTNIFIVKKHQKVKKYIKILTEILSRGSKLYVDIFYLVKSSLETSIIEDQISQQLITAVNTAAICTFP